MAGGKRKSIERSELIKLAYVNSKRLPQAVNDDGRSKEWVGVCWIDADRPQGEEG